MDTWCCMTAVRCVKCGNAMAVRDSSSSGLLFAGCLSYPACRHTMNFHDFLFQFFKQNGIPIYSWKQNCWRCGKELDIYYYSIYIELKKYHAKFIETDLGVCSSTSRISIFDKLLATVCRTYQLYYNKSRKFSSYENICPSCKIPQYRLEVGKRVSDGTWIDAVKIDHHALGKLDIPETMTYEQFKRETRSEALDYYVEYFSGY